MGLFFQSGLDNIQLDIVGFLAILGEATVEVHAQVASLSKWSFLPRLIPAPQALIRAERPDRLAPSIGRKVVGTKSGNIREHLNHIADLLHEDGEQLAEHEVRVIAVEETIRANTPLVKVKQMSPITGLAILGSLMAAGLLAFSVVWGDGYSTIATLLLSSLSSLIGIGSKWNLQFSEREDRRAPQSDVVIVYPHGAFLIIKCKEATARRLYWAPEKCIYNVGTQGYRAISLVATLFLMGGVITLANSTPELQLAWAVAYMVLNAAYWTVAAMPNTYNWELSNFEHWQVETKYKLPPSSSSSSGKTDFVSPGPQRRASQLKKGKTGEKENDQYVPGLQPKRSFTQALWEAIACTKSSRWARISNIAPQTEIWDKWLAEAEERAKATQITEEIMEPAPPSRVAKRKIVKSIEAPLWDAKKAFTQMLEIDDNVTMVEDSEEPEDV